MLPSTGDRTPDPRIVSTQKGLGYLRKMLAEDIEITTSDGAMGTFVVHPDDDGPHPVVLFLMDAPGKRDRCCTRWPDASPPTATT